MSHEFQLATAETWPNPWPMYRALRDHDPVHHVVPPQRPEYDYYVLSRHADVWSAARDHQTFSSAQGLTVNYGELEMIGLHDTPPMVMQDPPVHTEFRKLVSRGFTPRQVETVEPTVRKFVVERLEKLRANGGGDIVTELFKPLPSMVVAHYLGVPEEDWTQFDGWTQAIVAANAVDGATTGALDAVGSMMAYFTGLIERRRTEPADDAISHLVAAGVGADGDTAGTLSILAFTFTMVTGGNDTVTGMLGGSMPLLHRRPDQRRLLLDDPEGIPDAVEELLRLTSPVQGLARTTTRDVTIGDTTIPAGRRVLLLYGSANRDERQYGPDAAELDVTRCPRNILTFSHGAHHCLGAAAARMQCRVALTELLARCPDFWLSARRTELAADRILDAAERLFTQRDPASIGMNEIAKAAGCSRATLYRYFDSREALRTAYVHRETRRLGREIMVKIADVVEPAERLLVSITTTLRMVRDNPALAAWFTTTRPPIGGEMAGRSEVIAALAAAFLNSLGPDDPTTVERRARWVVRMLTSLLMFPGRDEADERAMIAEFVVPIVTPASAAARKAGHPGPE
ncbi:cytochrome P450 130 Cyp130 [Mycobacterium tuberculosis M1384]|nr:cytochrome P450 130 Cyp130 [Mycobacterium tuberculosis M1030]KAX08159.1 cytochrome P450 130 Cyp130 [Mycobacterium tuberculosis M987]KAX11617.1 cytochrome P450 130 Cyp130 [Mycobacterium tuberculosis M990]KAX17822.1 cytochrome P450 130 Cyp130 [Mycobacterium tuberculosis M1004]KAX65113.1 cytochrome P450 130 Cyp130 [Mycobacterium tuberculosis M1024]KAX65364.1 cytochrome P450 130 Cyp130 [Mycobacterium tuberculosis M1022]KAX75631.1 cytochrome P450 130 Cyp130 [Mycobacterium tuberculosis M1025]KA